MSLDQYSQVPASNDLTNYFKTGMAPSSVKLAGWDMMADLASRLVALTTGGGSANTQTLTQTRALAALVTGLEIVYLPGFANTGATTFQPDGVTAKNVFAYGAALLGGELQTNVPAWLKYDGTQWNLLNPNDASGSFTLTLTGGSAGGTGTVNWRIIQGRLAVVTLYADLLETSNATTLTGTGVPAALQPNTTVMLSALAVRDGGVGAIGGQVSIPSASGTWTFGNAAPTIASSFPKAWTNTGSKGLLAQSFTYPLKQ